MSPRRIPENRLDELVDAATEVFIAHGYRLTQMADVAEAIGVAKGTVYGYVESKEALFYLCLQHADRSSKLERPEELPFPTPRPGTIEAALEAVLSRQAVPRVLAAALERERVSDVRAEFEAIVRDLYATLERFRKGIKLIDCCSDHPELSRAWQTLGRQPSRVALASYLERRMKSGQLRALPNPRLAARLIIEVTTTWAIHIHWDRYPQSFDRDEARENAVGFLVAALAKTQGSPEGVGESPASL